MTKKIILIRIPGSVRLVGQGSGTAANGSAGDAAGDGNAGGGGAGDDAVMVDEDQTWDAISLRCTLSLAALSDPTKGKECRHRACCNYQALREYVCRMKRCPIAGCSARLYRWREVERDDALRALLRRWNFPEHVHTVWRWGQEVRAEPPEQGQATSAVTVISVL